MQQELASPVAHSPERERSPSPSPSPAPSTTPLRGEVLFVSAEEQLQRGVELLGDGALVVTLPPPLREVRGRLGELLEELVERELARHGAPSPYLAAWSAMPEDAAARLEEQLGRAREVGGSGIAIILGSLAAIARPTLSLDDSTTLRWLASATAESPLTLVLDDADTTLLAHPAPVALEGMLRAPDPPPPPSPPSPASPPRTSASASASSSAPAPAVAPALASTPEHRDPARSSSGSDSGSGSGFLVSPEHQHDNAPEHEHDDHALTRNDTQVALNVEDVILAAAADDDIPVEVASVEAPPVLAAPPPVEQERATLPTFVAPAPPVIDEAAQAKAERKRTRATVGIPVSGPSDVWRTWAVALAGARGAQPLGAFERLFVESYVPLANAIADGLDDVRALRAFDEFRRSFERSYTDAFATFGATNRRPRLVMDAFDIATKQARLANARSAHVLVVDSMRWDLGCMVRDALAREAQGALSLTSECLLWSSLPTTTMRQLETFARGMDALRAPADATEDAVESLRGRASEVVRRLRVGSRELYKLDLVPAMLEGAQGSVNRPAVPVMLEEIANATVECIARHVALLPPRTLLFIVGDHGFSIDRRGDIYTGGASPEEVLMPAQSWLVGALH